MSFPVTEIRKDFPILSTLVKGKPLIYLDNAATSQKPLRVINAINEYYEQTNSNIHRGAHYLANKATEAYENSRKTIAAHINAKSDREINFVRGTTEAINLVAKTYGRKYIKAGDESDHLHSRAPLQYSAMADALRGNRGAATGHYLSMKRVS
jgi:cysteine desulfurase/selenocysteine lyase